MSYLTRLRVPAILFILAVALVLPSSFQRATAQEPPPVHDHATAPGSKHHVLTNPNLSIRREPMAAVECNETIGLAGTFPCHNIDLLGFVPTNVEGGSGSDLWGWVDTATGTEYALMGHSEGVSFTNITADPPIFVGFLPTHAPNVLWRDVDVYGDYMYTVADGDLVTPHGLQIFDLKQLRNALPGTQFQESGHYAGFGNGHTVYINPATGHLFVAGSNTCRGGEDDENGGLHMLDLTADPLNPTFRGCDLSDGYTHETQCIVYNGPDQDHRGKEVCFNHNGDFAPNINHLTLVDVTADADVPLNGYISRVTYEGAGYTHQGWVTDDHTTLVMNDEYDELNGVTAGAPQNYRTYFWNITDLDNPVLVDIVEGPNKAIDHNLYVRGGLIFEGNYTDGIRILDASDAINGNTTQFARFDTTPSAADEPTVFAGVWGNYPFFPSGKIIASDIGSGLFILRHTIPNFQVTVEGPGEFARQGEIANYTITITNIGNAPATDVLVTDTLNEDVEVNETEAELAVGESVSYPIARLVSGEDCATGLNNSVRVTSDQEIGASYYTLTPCESSPTAVSVGTVSTGTAPNVAPMVALALLGTVGGLLVWRRRRA